MQIHMPFSKCTVKITIIETRLNRTAGFEEQDETPQQKGVENKEFQELSLSNISKVPYIQFFNSCTIVQGNVYVKPQNYFTSFLGHRKTFHKIFLSLNRLSLQNRIGVEGLYLPMSSTVSIGSNTDIMTVVNVTRQRANLPVRNTSFFLELIKSCRKMHYLTFPKSIIQRIVSFEVHFLLWSIVPQLRIVKEGLISPN